MEIFINFANHYFDIVFARSEQANVFLAMIYSLLAFSALYLFLAVPAYILTARLNECNLISCRNFHKHQIISEIGGSIVSILMYAVLGGIAFYLFKNRILIVKGDISPERWLVEVFALYCWNEIHFYCCHRILHTRWLYKRVHLEHHRSVRVTPLASWRFHWLEALLLGSVLPLALLFYSFSVWSLLVLPVISIIWNIIGHSNWQTNIPFIGNASKRHALHHSKFNGNYGFSSKLPDRIFGTNILESRT